MHYSQQKNESRGNIIHRANNNEFEITQTQSSLDWAVDFCLGCTLPYRMSERCSIRRTRLVSGLLRPLRGTVPSSFLGSVPPSRTVDEISSSYQSQYHSETFPRISTSPKALALFASLFNIISSCKDIIMIGHWLSFSLCRYARNIFFLS